METEENILMAGHLASAAIWYEEQIEQRRKYGRPHDDLDMRKQSCRTLLNDLLPGL